jgi:hypothetical protein
MKVTQYSFGLHRLKSARRSKSASTRGLAKRGIKTIADVNDDGQSICCEAIARICGSLFKWSLLSSDLLLNPR